MEGSSYAVLENGAEPPALGMADWTGERHRGGLAVADSSGTGAKGAGWIFGPEQITPGQRRVQVNVGTGYSIDLAAPFATWLLGRVLAESDDDRRSPIDDQARPITPTPIQIEIDRVPVDFGLVQHRQNWLAQGVWNGWAVEVIGTSVEASEVKLQRLR
jgi:hypothetical protein